jgi:hypothetical protein
MGFPPGHKALMREYDDDNWVVHRSLQYTAKDGRSFTVHPGMHTDFASVPRMFVWFLPRYGRYTKAAILHDYLWREVVPAGRLTLVQADHIFRQAMAEMGVPFLRRWIMWAAVRWGALVKRGGRKGWWREGWRAVLVSLVAAPIVLPPAVLIVIALVLFYVFEMLSWLPLGVAGRARRKRPSERDERPPKATRPRFPVEAVRSL